MLCFSFEKVEIGPLASVHRSEYAKTKRSEFSKSALENRKILSYDLIRLFEE